MPKPVTIPNTFATATTAIPLTNLDADFTVLASAVNDANSYSNYAADTGTANAYVVTLTGVTTTYTAGLRIQFTALNANTTASTVNVNGQGAKNITFQDTTALSSGTIAANSIVDIMYDGTQFLLMNKPSGGTTGDVLGPASAVTNRAVTFNGTTGKLVQDSKVTITPPATGSTLTIAEGKTLTASKTLTLDGTDGTTMTFPNTSASVARTDAAQTFFAAQTFQAANAIRSEEASTQDAVVIAGRAGGSSSYAVTLTPATLAASRTLTLPEPGSNETLGYLNIPQNSQSANYTLVLTDAGKHIFHPSADTTARTFTIPANSSVAFPIGTAITFINQNGAGVITITITTDTMRLSPTGVTGNRSLAANGTATCVKITATEWIISGSGLS